MPDLTRMSHNLFLFLELYYNSIDALNTPCSCRGIDNFVNDIDSKKNLRYSIDGVMTALVHRKSNRSGNLRCVELDGTLCKLKGLGFRTKN